MAEYVYRDADGEALARKVIDGHGPDKRVRWEHPDGDEWKPGRGDAEIPLYRLPEVLKGIGDGREIWLAEGERDAENLRKIGLVATCSPDGASMGANSKWLPRYGDDLRGARVAICFDADDAGRAHMQATVNDLAQKAKQYRVMSVAPDVVHKGADVSDHLESGHAIGDLVEIEVEADDEGPALGVIPEYPVTGITGPLREFVDWAVRDGLPAAAAGHAGLAALAAVCGSATADYPVRANTGLWLCVIGASGSGKSPAAAHAFGQLEAAAERDTQLYREQREVWQESVKAQRAAEPARPASPTISDLTIEALAEHMDRSGGPAAIVVDELESHLSSIGQYRVGRRGADADWARLREMHTGKPVHILRVGKQIDIYAPVLTIYGPLTPGQTWKLGSPTNGDWARWLPARVPTGTPAIPARPEGKPKAWVKAMDKLIGKRGQRRVWQIDGETRSVLDAASSRWRERRWDRKYPPPEHVAQCLNKAANHATRIAIVLAESMNPGGGGEIPPSAMMSAVAVMDYVIAVWASLPGETETLRNTYEDRLVNSAAERLLTFIESQAPDEDGVRRVTRRQIQHGHIAGARRPQAVDDLIKAYQLTYGEATVATRKLANGMKQVVVSEPARVTVATRNPGQPTVATASPPKGNEEDYVLEEGERIPPPHYGYSGYSGNSGPDRSEADGPGTERTGQTPDAGASLCRWPGCPAVAEFVAIATGDVWCFKHIQILTPMIGEIDKILARPEDE